MEKRTTYPVSPEFILKAHSLACPEWKARLENMYPSVFKSRAFTVNIGHKVKFNPQDEHEYVIAQVGMGIINLIRIDTGNRWTDTKVKVEDVNNIPLKTLKTLAGSENYTTMTINGVPVMQRPTKKKTLVANVEDILDAYGSAKEEIKKIIREYFPQVFQEEYIQLIPDDKSSLTISPNGCNIDDVPSEIMISNFLAPSPELKHSTIMFNNTKMKVELIDNGIYTHIAFKRKF